MSEIELQTSKAPLAKMDHEKLLQLLKSQFQAADCVRRGICLLNAGQYEQAEAAFNKAKSCRGSDESLPAYLAACLLGQGRPEAAAEHFERVVEQDKAQTAVRIRHALSLASAGQCEAAMQSLREGITRSPESAELHFQLGTLLSSIERYEEAELRFSQAINIDPDHTEALVSLALCCGLRNVPGEALPHLQRAQARRPHDARLGLLLAQAAKAVQQQGFSVRVRAYMPDGDPVDDERGMAELSRVIESEPDFVDAFLAIPVGRVDERVFAMLLATLERALERQPAHAELHYQCGRVLARLGRREDAISENEQAVLIDPRFTRSLIELGKLYQQTDRSADASTRLEQAIAAGAEYADVYYLLGNLYRKQGFIGRARSAYRRALVLNDHYDAAIKALEALPVA
ncbi:MAG: tetratricopeptide repeat protein [Planctomycetes bacterium]|nr:tetratricopeptide repeat protein [Planctomycetota bacterium]